MNDKITNNTQSKLNSKASLDEQDVVYQGPDIVLTPVVSGSSREYTDISLSIPATRNLSDVTEGTDDQEQDAADSNLENPINDKDNNIEDCATYQEPDIPNFHKNGSKVEEQCPEYEGPDLLLAFKLSSLNADK